MKNKIKEIYKCGHPVKEVVINTTEYTLSTYIEWKNSDSNICLDCWLKGIV